MADDYTLIQRIAEAGGNASGYCSAKEARQFLAMLRTVQEHDQRQTSAPFITIDHERQTEEKVHPWEGLLD